MSAPCPDAPGGCTTEDALAKKHAADAAFVESKIAMMKKPRLGRPVASASVELQAAALKEELAKKMEAEREALAAYLAYKVAHPDPVAADLPSTGVTHASGAEAGVGAAAAADDSGGEDEDATADDGGGQKKSKAQRRREKKAAAAAASAAAIDAAVKAFSSSGLAAGSAAAGPGRSVSLAGASGNVALKEVEVAAIEAKLKPSNLGIHMVAADGNCLFRAAADQLQRMGRGSSSGSGSASEGASSSSSSSAVDYGSLRKRAATYIRLHALEFAPFLPYEPADGYPEDEPGNEAKVRAAVDKYCQRLANTAAWGGHPEIRALASTLGVPIVVYQAEGDAWRMAPDTDEGDVMLRGSSSSSSASSAAAFREDSEGVLRLSFHRHYYALGEHYNSVVRTR